MTRTHSTFITLVIALLMIAPCTAQVTTRSLTWNLTGTRSWPTVAAGNNWMNRSNWVITGTSVAPTTNVTNGDKLIIPNIPGVRINVTANLTIPLNNFVIETQGAARFHLNNGVDLILSGTATAFSMQNSAANAGLTLGRRGSATNPTQLIINGIVKASNKTGALIVPSSTSALSLQALSSSSAAETTTGFGGFLLGALPVTLGNFNANLDGNNKVSVQWTTLEEINTDHFDLQRSTDGAHWNVIGSFKAAGNSSTVRAYSAQDPSPAIGNNFYRLLMVDADGASRFSAIKRIRFDAQGKISVYPNPATQLVTVSLGRAALNDWQLTLTNSQGQVLLHNKYSGSSTTIALDVQHFQNGTYYLQWSDGATIQTSKLLVVHP